jgi:hypothetical protein
VVQTWKLGLGVLVPAKPRWLRDRHRMLPLVVTQSYRLND